MEQQILNSKPDIHKLTNGNPLPGSYVIRDGKFFPNPDDEAMKARNEKRETKDEEEKEKLKDKEV